ncbi:hypothetical protein [Pedobacter cryophilus]|uniref:Outer membrane protein beta-barrel domain-containing protein n=1 Tax=Pedobacter cryophilus TaxID=2571271 RepID=A0A4U1C4T4_9SPHI|nr:hypothetical protein [Pedobacter cryophilus]TKC00896.1 hypothetical protein FA046_04255 [Pedobacter cryophilus]
MKKNKLTGIIAVAAITLLQFTGAFAQSTDDGHQTRLGFGLGLGVPTKSYMGDVVIAPDLRLQHDLGERTSLTLTTGYYGFIGKEKDAFGNELMADLIPLKAGAKFFFGNTFYFQPEVGVSFSTKEDYGNPFTYAPSLGYANNKWDFALRYEGFEYDNSSNGMVAFRVAYAFKRPNK